VTATVIVCALVVSAVAALFIGAWIRAGKQ
jgi:hypothetical protein